MIEARSSASAVHGVEPAQIKGKVLVVDDVLAPNAPGPPERFTHDFRFSA